MRRTQLMLVLGLAVCAFAAGAGALGAGLILVLTSGPPAKKNAIAPLALPGGVGVALRRSF